MLAHEEELAALIEDPPACGSSPTDRDREMRHRGGAARRLPGERVGEELKGRQMSGDLDSGEERQMSGDLDTDTESLHKFWHRAGWLVFLLMCQSTSSVILEHFDMLIRTHPVVIYFLTMLVGAGGNAGSQSTVLVVRQLALAAVGRKKGEIQDDRFSLRRIVTSEASVGGRLALVLFVGTFVRCVLFQVRGRECLAICLSMLAIVFVSTLLGAALPIFLSRMHIDPAHAGATIQVIMDISGVALTCVVSCFVLGLPINGPLQKSSNSTAVHSAGLLHRVIEPFSIQHEGMRRGLNQFGGTTGRMDLAPAP